MDRYILLDSLREYFYELVPSVRFTGRNGEYNIEVIDPVTLTALGEKPGIFLDGVLCESLAVIANIPCSEIKRITILPFEYYYKDLSFGGIIDIHTKKSDFSIADPLPNMSRFVFPLANSNEYEFQAPDYSRPDEADRSPDLRYLLYWSPAVKRDGSGTGEVNFYTGDIAGDYLIRIEGISGRGELLKAEAQILVEP
jgi:hypothetical protein